jgi:hypothetical protein
MGGASGYLTARMHKPADTIVQPKTFIRTPVKPDLNAGPALTPGHGAAAAIGLTRSEARLAATTWPGLEQSEIDALTVALKDIPKVPVMIFCQNDALCGDMQMDFENAFESAKWDVKTEAPILDGTVGIATSSAALRDAINAATKGRLTVGEIQKNAPYEALVIGRRPRA